MSRPEETKRPGGPPPGPGGPKGPRGMRGGPKAKNPGKTMKRLVGIVLKGYPVQCALVLVSIVVSVLANVRGSLFLQTLIDDYITPMIGDTAPNFGPLLGALATMALIYAVGACSSYLYNRLMIHVTQGSLKKIRDQLFEHMESLAIPYFDRHAHGDIMSIYTNDTDTLRQLINQSVPQLISSTITIVSVFISMVRLSPILTVLVILMIVVLSYLMEASYLMDVAILYGLLNVLAIVLLSRIIVSRHRERKGEEP